jgi:hypothetical protein
MAKRFYILALGGSLFPHPFLGGRCEMLVKHANPRPAFLPGPLAWREFLASLLDHFEMAFGVLRGFLRTTIVLRSERVI